MVLTACAGVQAVAEHTAPAGRCTAVHIESSVVSTQARELVCNAAHEVLAFFRSLGVEVKDVIAIQIADHDIDARLPHIGSYSSENKLVKLLSLKEAVARHNDNKLFGLSMNKALYRSVVAHELAHALADQNFGFEEPPLVVHEYIAYVVQLSTMDPELRAEVLAGSDVAAYEDVSEMSCVYYAMDPSGFGIKAYRHYVALSDPGAFIRRLLSGAIRVNDIGTE